MQSMRWCDRIPVCVIVHAKARGLCIPRRERMYEWAARTRDRAPFTPVSMWPCVCVCIVRWNVVLRFLALAPCRCYSLSPRSGRRFLPWILFAFWTSSTLFPFLLIPQLQTRLQSYPSCYLPLSCVGCLSHVSVFLSLSLSFSLLLSPSLCFSIANPLPFHSYLPASIAVIYGLYWWI